MLRSRARLAVKIVPMETIGDTVTMTKAGQPKRGEFSECRESRAALMGKYSGGGGIRGGQSRRG